MKGFKSYLLFLGKSASIGTVITFAIAFVILFAAKIIAMFNINFKVWDFFHFFGEVMWITVILYTLRGLFNANLKTAPGYRFFHALPNASSHFRNALIITNISLIIGTAIFTGIDFLLFEDTSPMLLIALAWFSLGWMNLFGNTGIFWPYLIPVFISGFSGGFLNGMLEDDEKVHNTVQLAILAVCAVFCAVGIAYNLINSKRLWKKEK